ncbi:methyltransferase family protein [Stackebrandtia endophytica]|uniref:Methyltransferase family protein n=1 Tax=Stackebrandtia endophytica TaxID=1496996 RepID=A0A543AST8_9ACTN|nr:methyltransferase domain-containing protein [Stackebrandtia endophytica]TQL75616.1 methyltransferase family protein [Stackebrandtia endophytica]
MSESLSPRLSAIVDALPLSEGLRVLEIGCGPGAAAREVARRIGTGHVMGIDRSGAAIGTAVAGSESLIASGVLSFRQVAIEEFTLDPTDVPFDLAYAVRVGALDGRHPEIETEALRRIAAALTPSGRLFVDAGDPLREIDLP